MSRVAKDKQIADLQAQLEVEKKRNNNLRVDIGLLRRRVSECESEIEELSYEDDTPKAHKRCEYCLRCRQCAVWGAVQNIVSNHTKLVCDFFEYGGSYYGKRA